MGCGTSIPAAQLVTEMNTNCTASGLPVGSGGQPSPATPEYSEALAELAQAKADLKAANEKIKQLEQTVPNDMRRPKTAHVTNDMQPARNPTGSREQPWEPVDLVLVSDPGQDLDDEMGFVLLR